MATKAKSDWLTEECKFYARHYGYAESNFEKGLEGFATHLFAQEQGFDELLQGNLTTKVKIGEYICRSDDLGIDAVLEDNDNNRILLMQATWKSNASNLEDKVGHFFDAPQRIMSGEYRATGGEQIRELLRGFDQKVNDGWTVLLRFVTNASVGANEKLAKLTESKNRAYEAASLNFRCELLGESELRTFKETMDSAISGGLVQEVTLNFQAGKVFQLNDPYRTVVGAIKGNELVRLYQTRGVGYNLFNLNVRLPLATQGVNPKMIETAASEEEGPHFFYYNNGVSAVCSEYELDNNKVTAKRFQIINGAQTVNALSNAYDTKPSNEVYVLLRLTETTDKYGGSFTESIIRYNNTQNPIVASDFFSNDRIQLWLRDKLPAALSGKGAVPNFYYIYKAGYKPKGATGSGIKIDELGKIRHAFLYGPNLSYKSPKDIFSMANKKKIYWEAFGVEGRPVDFWNEEELAKLGAAIALNGEIQKLGKTLKAETASKDSDEAKYIARLSRYLMGLVAVGLEAVREETFHDYTTLIASKTTFNKHVGPILRQARASLRSEYKRRKKDRPEQQPEYNLARDKVVWVTLSDDVREAAINDRVVEA